MSETQLSEDVTAALNTAKLLDAFQALPPSHRREYLSWIDEAKKSATRAARIQKMCAMLAAKSSAS